MLELGLGLGLGAAKNVVIVRDRIRDGMRGDEAPDHETGEKSKLSSLKIFTVTRVSFQHLSLTNSTYFTKKVSR